MAVEKTESAIRDEFARAATRAGLVFKREGEPFMDGTLHRVPVETGKPSNKDGAYVGFLDGRPSGFIQNYLTGTKETWTTEGRDLSQEERARFAREVELARLRRATDQDTRQRTAAGRVQGKWDRLSDSPAEGQNAYLARKGVEAFGVKFNGEQLVVPARDADGKLWSLQTIAAEKGGPKLFEKGGRKTGNFHLIGEPKAGEPLLVAEGYATAASLHQATGRVVAVAFDSGNLDSVVGALKKRHSESLIYVMGDDDHRQKVNVGVEKAMAAAEKHQVGVAFPVFQDKTGRSDFNDLQVSEGVAAVKAQVEAATSLSPKQSRDAAAARAAVQVDTPTSQRLSPGQVVAVAVDSYVVQPADLGGGEVKVAARSADVPTAAPIVSAPSHGREVAARDAADAPASLTVTTGKGDDASRVAAQAVTGISAASDDVNPGSIPLNEPGSAARVPHRTTPAASPPGDTLARTLDAQETPRTDERSQSTDAALRAAIDERALGAIVTPRNALSAGEAREWVQADVASFKAIGSEVERGAAAYDIGKNAHDQLQYKLELSRQDADTARVAAGAYMQSSVQRIFEDRLSTPQPWSQSFDLSLMQERHADLKRDGVQLQNQPKELVDTLAREDVLTLQRVRGHEAERAAYALIGDVFKNEVYRETFNRESLNLNPAIQATDREDYRRAAEQLGANQLKSAVRRQSVERRSADIEPVPIGKGLGQTVAREIVTLDLDALRGTESAQERIKIAATIGANSLRQDAYRSELTRQDPEIAAAITTMSQSGRDLESVRTNERPHLAQGRAAAGSPNPDEVWMLPILTRGGFASERDRPLTPISLSAEEFAQTLVRADRAAWDNRQFVVPSAPALAGDFAWSVRDPAFALARARGILLEDDPLARYIKVSDPSPAVQVNAGRAGQAAAAVNSIEQQARDQAFDDAGTAALRRRIGQMNEALTPDPARERFSEQFSERTLETIGRMTRAELDAFLIATARSVASGEKVIDAAQKRIESDLELRAGRSAVPPLDERFTVVTHLMRRDFMLRDKQGEVGFTERWLSLQTAHDSAAVIKGMLDRADERGWATIRVKGSAEFQRLAWVAAEARGIKAVGYIPTDGDRAAAVVERARLADSRGPELRTQGGTILREATRGPDNPGWAGVPAREATAAPTRDPAASVDAASSRPAQAGTDVNALGAVAQPSRQAETSRAPEPAIAQPLRSFLESLGQPPKDIEAIVSHASLTIVNERVYVGLVNEIGRAPYGFQQDAKESPFVKLQGQDGERIIWGVDLPRAVEAGRVKVGDSIALEFRNKEPVVVSVQDRDAAGKVVGTHDEEVLRNQWFAVKLVDLREQALQSQVTPDRSGDVLDGLTGPAAAAVAPSGVTPPLAGDTTSRAPAPGLSAPRAQGAEPAPAVRIAVAAVPTAAASKAPKPEIQEKAGNAHVFAAFEMALKQNKVPESMHAVLRQAMREEFAAQLARGANVGVRLYDASAPKEVARTITAVPNVKRDDHRISR